METIVNAIRDASTLGFQVVSLSGGEPLLYRGLSEVIHEAHRAGSVVNLVSNGILIPSSRFQSLVGRLGVVALSLDGLPERHNALRRSARSFDQVERAARYLSSIGQPFGIIHTLTSGSLEEVEDLAGLAVRWGARLLQLHPFERAGRAATLAGVTPLNGDERLVAFVLAAHLQARYAGALTVQVDLVHRDTARTHGELLHAAPLREGLELRHLVLQDDGSLVPLVYGIDTRWCVADLSIDRLGVRWEAFMQSRWPALRRLTRAAALDVARGRHGEVVAWHELLRRYAGLDHEESSVSAPHLSGERSFAGR